MKKRKQNLPRPAVHRMELWWAALPIVPATSSAAPARSSSSAMIWVTPPALSCR